MDKRIPAIILVTILVSVGIVFSLFPETKTESKTFIDHQYVNSGPIAVTQYKHRLGDNVFLIIGGLQPHENGTIGVFTPEGILYKSFEYDGSKKSSFNQYLYPVTTASLNICKPEQLVGIWKVIFANNAYPPLEFEMTDTYVIGANKSINTVC